MSSFYSEVNNISNVNMIGGYTTTSGQKKFGTKTSMPNMPKVQGMFFVYFSLNPMTEKILEKKIDKLYDIVSTESANIKLNDEFKTKEKMNKAVSTSIAKNIASEVGILGVMDKYRSSFYDKKTSDEMVEITANNNSRAYGDYIPSKDRLKSLSYALSTFIKDIDKPSVTFEVGKYNEYNRKRIAYKSMKFNPININFYDVKDSPIQELFFTYLKIISNDFYAKNIDNFSKQIVNNEFDGDNTNWGFDLDSNFRLIDRISICEYHTDKMMVYTIENPVLTSIKFGKNEVNNFSANTVSVTFDYEGFTNDLIGVSPYNVEINESKEYLKSMINRHITPDMAEFLNVRYNGDIVYGSTIMDEKLTYNPEWYRQGNRIINTGGNTEQPNYKLGKGTYEVNKELAIDTSIAFIKGLLDAPTDEKWEVFKSQSIDTLRKIGFAEEIRQYNMADDFIDTLKSSKDKGKYLFKAFDNPSSMIGQYKADEGSTSMREIIKMFF